MNGTTSNFMNPAQPLTELLYDGNQKAIHGYKMDPMHARTEQALSNQFLQNSYYHNICNYSSIIRHLIAIEMIKKMLTLKNC